MQGVRGRHAPDVSQIRNSYVLRWFLQQLVAEKLPKKHFTVSFDNAEFLSFGSFSFFACETKKENERKKKINYASRLDSEHG